MDRARQSTGVCHTSRRRGDRGRGQTMRCPQCGAETPDEEWNCMSCRINLYWAHQHFAELAHIRKQQGLQTRASTPAFLLTPNFVAGRPARTGATTSLDLIAAVADAVHAAGAPPLLCEFPGTEFDVA